MKKFLSFLIAAVMIATMSMTLIGCDTGADTSELERKIAEAEKMTLAELEAAAKEEIGENTLKVQAVTSGISKIAAGFKAKYGIDCVGSSSPSKDSALNEVITTALDANEYYVDVVLFQDASALQAQINEGNFFNYVPNGLNTNEGDDNPLTGLYLNKLFVYTQKVAGTPDLTNVWQLAGTSADAGHISTLSFQMPTRESVNMNFLIMLTKPENCAKLETAYQAYYGRAWSAAPDKANHISIGHKYISEFIANVSSWHTSDTDAVKGLVGATPFPAGTVVYAPLNKTKDAVKIDEQAESKLKFSGYTTGADVAGFSGFMYRMYLQVLKTAKYPYAACLLINYMMQEEGYKAGWQDVGYYSGNIDSGLTNSADKPLSHWESRLIYEDLDYLTANYVNVSKFIMSRI